MFTSCIFSAISSDILIFVEYKCSSIARSRRCIGLSFPGCSRSRSTSFSVNYPLPKANGLPASQTSFLRSTPVGAEQTSTGCLFCSLLSPQALIRAVPALYYYFYAICLNPSSSIFFAALISLSCFVPQTGHIHSLTDRFFVSVFWYPQAEHN